MRDGLGLLSNYPIPPGHCIPYRSVTMLHDISTLLCTQLTNATLLTSPILLHLVPVPVPVPVPVLYSPQRNLYTLLAVVDPVTIEGAALLLQLQAMHQQQYPLRFGVVLACEETMSLAQYNKVRFDSRPQSFDLRSYYHLTRAHITFDSRPYSYFSQTPHPLPVAHCSG